MQPMFVGAYPPPTHAPVTPGNHTSWTPHSYSSTPQLNYGPPLPTALAYQNNYYAHPTQQPLHQPPPEPTIFREVVFSDITLNTVNSTTTRQAGAKRKHNATSARSTAQKRRNIQTAITPSTSAGSTAPVQPIPLMQPVPGVGPQAPQIATNAVPRELHPSIARVNGPISHHGSLLNKTSSAGSSVAQATDVWYFTRGLTADKPPFAIPEREKPSELRPDPKVFDFLGCIICP